MTLNSITHAIPLTAQTDPNKFPRGEYQPYPRMMVTKDGKPFYDPTGRIPVIVQNEDEEADFRAAHPGEVRDNVATAADDQNELATLRAENARLKAMQQGGDQVEPKSAQPQTSVSSLVKPASDNEPVKPAAQAAARRTPPRKLD